EIVDRIDELRKRIAQPPLTLIHFDARLDNLMFGPSSVVFLDWQLVMHGRGVQDLAYFVGGGLTSEVQATEWEGLLSRYHDRLCASGVGNYSWDDCLQDYREAVLLT